MVKMQRNLFKTTAAYVMMCTMAFGMCMPTEAIAQKAKKNQSVTTFTHPWQGKRVAYFGDSITDPNNRASKNKYWSLLEEWLGIKPFVYAVSGRQWNDIPRQAEKLKTEHGDDFDAILIMMGTNDYNNAVPLGRWYDERMETVEYGHGYAKRKEDRMRRHLSKDKDTYRGRINIALDTVKRMFPTKQIVHGNVKS